VAVSGTLSGVDQEHKLIDVFGHALDVPLSDHLLIIRYDDGPGLIGKYGARLGEAGVNIAGMQVSRSSQGGEAVAVITIDSALPEGVLDAVAEAVGVSAAREVNLED
jgi:D-3-phosphoglycerate dehydrogenase